MPRLYLKIWDWGFDFRACSECNFLTGCPQSGPFYKSLLRFRDGLLAACTSTNQSVYFSEKTLQTSFNFIAIVNSLSFYQTIWRRNELAFRFAEIISFLQYNPTYIRCDLSKKSYECWQQFSSVVKFEALYEGSHKKTGLLSNKEKL